MNTIITKPKPATATEQERLGADVLFIFIRSDQRDHGLNIINKVQAHHIVRNHENFYAVSRWRVENSAWRMLEDKRCANLDEVWETARRMLESTQKG